MTEFKISKQEAVARLLEDFKTRPVDQQFDVMTRAFGVRYHLEGPANDTVVYKAGNEFEEKLIRTILKIEA